jgi:hypothetical protein
MTFQSTRCISDRGEPRSSAASFSFVGEGEPTFDLVAVAGEKVFEATERSLA